MFNNNYSAVKYSVCSVISTGGVGTGWLYRRTNGTVSDKTIYVVTAAHMVVERDENNNDILSNPNVLIQNVNNSGQNQYFSTKVISVDKKGDIALLEIQNHRGENNKFALNWPYHRSLSVTTVIQQIGIQIYIVGYPMGFDYNSIAGGYLRENNASDSFTPTSLYYNLATNPGNSGSPVFNTSNLVIGMLQWGSSGDEMNGGIRGDLLYYFLETSITNFISSNKTSYNKFFKKQYINIFADSLTSFVPLSGELIQFCQNYQLGMGYANGGRNVDGILLLNDYYLTDMAIEKITYTTLNNVSKTITLSSSLYDRTSIWEVLYFAKPNSSITLYTYRLLSGASEVYTLQLSEMPGAYDYFLTEGFTKKQQYENIMAQNKNIDNVIMCNNKFMENTNLKKYENVLVINEPKKCAKCKKCCNKCKTLC